MMPCSLGLPPQLFAKAFPFHLVLNDRNEIIQVGEVLQRVHSVLLVGELLGDHFYLRRPRIACDVAAIRKQPQALFLLESRQNGMQLRGQMLGGESPEPVFFLGSPWAVDATSLHQYGLDLKDFAIHDPIANYLMLEDGADHATPPLSNAMTGRVQSDLAEQCPLKILLAEDMAVNQKVALHVLQQMGYRADVAGNGLEVLQALHRQPYDVVLMDLHMPEMDGLEATRLLREQKFGSDRLQIIALTADVMQGAREACLKAGMDAYLTKPIRTQDLLHALAEVYQNLAAHREQDRSPDAPPQMDSAGVVEEPILDHKVLQDLQDLAGPQIEIVIDIINSYLDDLPNLLQAIHQAIERSDAPALRKAAHALRSTSATVGAVSLAERVKPVEELGRTGTTIGAKSRMASIHSETERVRKALQHHFQDFQD
ncbi:MAG: response regulator [Leptolyngbyaceae cyanobacterium bins.59]|nr:response regulator [Leptolyngbyaceae cyanobacterium bins.59]